MGANSEISRIPSALWDVPGFLRILMILGGTPFTRTSCFVVESVVQVSPVLCFEAADCRMLKFSPPPFQFTSWTTTVQKKAKSTIIITETRKRRNTSSFDITYSSSLSRKDFSTQRVAPLICIESCNTRDKNGRNSLVC